MCVSAHTSVPAGVWDLGVSVRQNEALPCGRGGEGVLGGPQVPCVGGSLEISVTGDQSPLPDPSWMEQPRGCRAPGGPFSEIYSL